MNRQCTWDDNTAPRRRRSSLGTRIRRTSPSSTRNNRFRRADRSSPLAGKGRRVVLLDDEVPCNYDEIPSLGFPCSIHPPELRASALKELNQNSTTDVLRSGLLSSKTHEVAITATDQVDPPVVKTTKNASSSIYDELIAMKAAAFEVHPPCAGSSTTTPSQPPMDRRHSMPSSGAMIEIAAGVTARLRGAKETWDCIKNDNFLPATCYSCSENLFCIMDASFVLCPNCKVVSRMNEEVAGNAVKGGVGLGFRYDDLCVWQSDLLQSQQQQ